MTEHTFVGVDISKDKFNVAIEKDNKFIDKEFNNTLVGIKACYKWLSKEAKNAWVCMEATGCYGYKLADYLYQQKLTISVVNPLKIKHYAKAILRRNKNDVLDARLIASFAKAMRPFLYTPSNQEHKELKGLVNLLNLLKRQLVQLKNQHSSNQSHIAKKALKGSIKRLQKEIDDNENKMEELVKQDEEFTQKLGLITSIKGVGNLTAYHVLARTHTIEQFENAKQFAAFIGVSPKQCQSGKYQGQTRLSCLGDAGLRKALYMAALVAKRHNPALKPFVQRLAQKGKAPKAIIGAVMRKLAHWIFGVLKHNKPFQPWYA